MSAHGIERPPAARVGMVGLIVAEASLFAVFVVAYLWDLGKSLNGPSPSSRSPIELKVDGLDL